MMNISPTESQQRAGRIEVYTDGRCPLCLWLRARVEPLDREARIEWLDYNEPENQLRAAPHTLAALAEEMHVRRTDGTWSKGFEAWLDVLRVLPRWRWSARVLARWPFTALGPVFYAWLASRRYKLFGVPPPCDADGVCQLHSK